MIIARCDALTVEGIDEAVRRGHAYLEAGADMLFIESPRTIEEIAEIPRRLPVPQLFNMSSSGKTPFLSVDEITRLGYKLMILPNFTTCSMQVASNGCDSRRGGVDGLQKSRWCRASMACAWR